MNVYVEYGDVWYHAEVRWLSRGKVQKYEQKGKCQEAFSDYNWVFCLTFLTDIIWIL